MAENVPGDGYSTPFGNGQGATMTRGASKSGNDFVTNPRGNVSNAMGRDFTKENMNSKQPSGESNVDESTVPQGGKQLLADPTQPMAFTAKSPQMPFKNMKVPSPMKSGSKAPAGPESGGTEIGYSPVGGSAPMVGELPEEG